MGCCKCEEYEWADPQDAIVCDMKGNEYCLFHAPAELKQGRHEELMDAAWERMNCVTEYNVGLPEVEHKVCDLSGSIFADDADFSGLLFKGEAYFDSATFGGKADFNSASFKGKADFRVTSFGGEADFSFASFGGEANFRFTSFGEVAFFRFTSFGEVASFWSASFGGEDKKATTDFSHAILGASARLYFKPRVITGPFIADNTDFNGRVSFDGIHFKDKVSFGESNLGQVSFNLCKFDQQPIFDRADLRKAELIGAPVEDFRLMACKWPESKGRKVTYDARKINDNGFITIDNVKNIDPFPTLWGSEKPNIPPLKHLEDLYRRLKKVARAEMDEPLASDFHYAEKEMQRRYALIQFHNQVESRHYSDTPLSAREEFQGLGVYLTLSLYKLISEYGEGPLRAFLVLFALLLAPLFYLHLPEAWQPSFLAPPMNTPTYGLGAQWLHFIPLVKLPDANEAGWLARLLMLGSQLAITLQAALFGFALRNRFRR